MADDYYIINQSLSMQEVAESYGFYPNAKGFIKCPFHSNSSERTPSLKIYPGHRGFYCHACHTGGDVVKFVALLNDMDNYTALKELSERFGIPISGDGEVSEEMRQRSTKARLERQRRIALEEQKKAELRQINSFITAYRNIIQSEQPFTDLWCFAQNKLQFETYKQELVCLRNFRK